MLRRNSIRPVARLRRKELRAIVSSLQQFLYLSEDRQGVPCWDPDKEWSGADFAAYAAELLHLHGLAPDQKTPARGFDSDEVAETASCLQSDLAPAERLHLLSEVYRAVLDGVESFARDDAGADRAYLLGALVSVAAFS